MSTQKPTQVFFLVTLVALALAKPPEKIVGGTYASPGEFPHAVSIRKNGGHHCGGTIIDSQHILTAAHCIEGGNMAYPYSDITVVSGSNSISQGGNVHTVKRAMTPPSQYNPNTPYPNDIGVLTLGAPMNFDAYQAPVRLPTLSSYVGSPAVIAGWGSLVANGPGSNYLQKLQTTIQDIRTCQTQITSKILYDNEICTVQAYGTGGCSGDSGSGLIVNGEVVGVASFVIPCGIGYPDVFTKVSTYLDFINQERAQY